MKKKNTDNKKKRYLKGGGIHIHIHLRKEIYLKNQMVTSEI